MKFFASEEYNEAGRKLLDEGNYQEAEKLLLKATRAAPDSPVPWYNLGLVYKRQKRWAESLKCNQRATQLEPNDQAAWWNLGIAATGLGDWDEARRAWTAFGIRLPAGEGPIVMSLGPTPIRLNPMGNGEVVWCLRIDPARAIIKNIPLPASGHCFGDVLLHDGAPNGYRMFQGQEVPVFDELEILELSEYRTYEIKVLFRSLEDIEVLTELATQQELAVEDWATIRNLCKLCSEGRPHQHHQIESPSIDKPIRLGIAARNELEAQKLFEMWVNERSGCRLLEIECIYSH
ncbi:MAG: tetratricopeptide repeat protein [Chloroflexi bacterium]|nr:tetratricopeptide repeat protein [Chloroflexota bacterium]